MDFFDAPVTILPAAVFNLRVVFQVGIVKGHGIGKRNRRRGCRQGLLLLQEVDEPEFCGRPDRGFQTSPNELAARFVSGIVFPVAAAEHEEAENQAGSRCGGIGRRARLKI